MTLPTSPLPEPQFHPCPRQPIPLPYVRLSVVARRLKMSRTAAYKAANRGDLRVLVLDDGSKVVPVGDVERLRQIQAARREIHPGRRAGK